MSKYTYSECRYCLFIFLLLADSDFEPLIGSVRFFPGETVGAFGCVHIPVMDDSIVEEDETFTVTLTSAGVIQAIGETTATVTIFEDSDSKSPVQSPKATGMY